MAGDTLGRSRHYSEGVLHRARQPLAGGRERPPPPRAAGRSVPSVPLPRRRRKTSSMLEVDDEGGRMFLRVLIHLTMHDYAPLVSGALQLLFKHFSQRQEAVHTFKQVLLPTEPRPAPGGGGLRGPPGPAPSGRVPWPCFGLC